MSEIRKVLEKENVSEEKIQKVLKELGIKDSKRWVPEIGEEYWVVSNDGEVLELVWEGDGYDLHFKLTDTMFETRQEARDHLYKIYFLAQMKRDFEDNSDLVDWDDAGQNKYCIYRQNDELRTFAISTLQASGSLHTTNEEWLEQYISENETEIKKHCFGIE